MKSNIAQAVEAALAGVELAESRYQAFMYAIKGIEDWKRPNEAIAAVSLALNKEIVEAYGRVFMWGSLVNGPARAKAKEIALAKFLSERNSIMGFLETDGKSPGRWMTDEEKKFRGEIKALSQKIRKVTAKR